MIENQKIVADDQEDAAPARKSRLKRHALMALVPLLLLAGGIWYWTSLQGKVSTDNAYLKLDKVAISADVGGRIVDVQVHDGETVEPGALLFRVDPEPYRLRLAEADAAIATAQANVTALSNSTDLSGVDIGAARESIAFAQSTLSRQEALWKRGFTTKADYEAAQHAVEQARESLRQAQARQQEARAKLATGPAVPGQNPQVAAAKAQREEAQLNLTRTEVRAPSGGRVAEADRLQVGQQVMNGLPVLTIVADNAAYVEANFKETELDEIRVGQPADIHFDAYPDLVLRGHVKSIGAGTGSEFSVLPAQNATGNWVKVTQRVPVRIAIDQKSTRPLIAGLSVDVTVYTDGRR
ncbi:HlyD family secretion protein [Croceicoccus naphthovorans]|uniref:Secretion protein HlyD n=1 Tax=Croceicoccus naphthovorans TaxID=1348774 RepID=A0A0G3XEK8_9SPHN|nr:HlyD family secretion protein [Croceicoccus naphthovorans]AKM09051.1 secretion protein HlyD [Croceicoccus naphthovorans]MBB3991444.1 membrane fusion protein (multidrug efflux system) [Croceicoccus naphthovorans]